MHSYPLHFLAGQLSVHSSYQCLLLSSHPLHSLFTPLTSVCCSPLIPCTLYSLLLTCICCSLSSSHAPSGSAALSSSLALSVHSSYQCLLLLPHPLHFLLTPPNLHLLLSLLIPCTLWQCSFLQPVFTSLSSLALSVHSSYQCLLLLPHPLHSLLTPPNPHLLLSLLIPCTLWQCRFLLPVFASLSSSLALSVHSSYQCLLLPPHPLHSLLTPPNLDLLLSLLIPCTLWLCSFLLPVFLLSLLIPCTR